MAEDALRTLVVRVRSRGSHPSMWGGLGCTEGMVLRPDRREPSTPGWCGGGDRKQRNWIDPAMRWKLGGKDQDTESRFVPEVKLATWRAWSRDANLFFFFFFFLYF